jgi:hypothetical protein
MPLSATVEALILNLDTLVIELLLAVVLLAPLQESYLNSNPPDTEMSAEAAETPPSATMAVVARRTGFRIFY